MEFMWYTIRLGLINYIFQPNRKSVLLYRGQAERDPNCKHLIISNSTLRLSLYSLWQFWTCVCVYLNVPKIQKIGPWLSRFCRKDLSKELKPSLRKLTDPNADAAPRLLFFILDSYLLSIMPPFSQKSLNQHFVLPQGQECLPEGLGSQQAVIRGRGVKWNGYRLLFPFLYSISLPCSTEHRSSPSNDWKRNKLFVCIILPENKEPIRTLWILMRTSKYRMGNIIKQYAFN